MSELMAGYDAEAPFIENLRISGVEIPDESDPAYTAIAAQARQHANAVTRGLVIARTTAANAG